MSVPRTRDIPKSIWVGDHPWEIKFKRKIDNQGTRGECCPDEKTILIKLGQQPLEMYQTFLHEVLHAFEEEYEMDIPHPIIYMLEEALADFLIANFESLKLKENL